ncbi:holo-ACP synthase [Saccharospirillum sp. MSK14-1]|uniref:holo-ACP synthase n=1 Tax=Saccharospirillum sp. MSK14-1 TaxID=1897632 RepID=UPI001E2C2D45|nr:holo-ACP synthase [Saccharospirillum sp. MSK14-1]
MIRGIGTDIVDIERIQAVLERQGERFVRRILTAAEQAEYQRRGEPVKFLANRFAGKEAVAKALGTGIADGVTFQHIEILPGKRGAPEVQLTGRAAQLAQGDQVLLSLTDERRSVVAFALFQTLVGGS